MRSPLRSWWLAAAVATATPVLPLEAQDEQPLPLAEALALAARANPELLLARERAAAQAARGDSAGRQRLPRVTASLAWSHTDNPSYVFAHKLNAGEFTQDDFAIQRLNAPPGISHLTSLVSVEAPLDLAGRVRDQAAAQRAGARALSEAANEAQLELRLRVIEAYRRAHLAERAVEVTERALRAAQARERDLDARAAEGAALEADRLRARARRRQREADVAERRGEREVALAGLARVLGAEAGRRYVPSEAPPSPRPLEADEAAWRDRAQGRRPGLVAASERVSAAELARRAEQRSSWPELGAFAQLQDDRNTFASGGQSATFGIGLRWSVFDPTRAKRLGAAAAESRAAELEARAAADQVRFEVAAAFRRAQATRQRWDAAAGGATEGREALRVVRERRLAGLATLTDELETEAAALLAELHEIQAATEVDLADAALRRAAGEP